MVIRDQQFSVDKFITTPTPLFRLHFIAPVLMRLMVNSDTETAKRKLHIEATALVNN